ncbi:MAG: cyclic nucleotide-binding domain-containing protein, partial [Chrysiogenales bacterium]
MENYNDKEIIGILGNIPIFQGLEKTDYAEILPLLRLEKYPPGAQIIREGAQGDSMCIIIRGTVRVTKTDESEVEIPLEILYPGSYFGEFSLVDNMPRSANVIGIDETELFRLEKRDFDALLSKNITIANAFYKNCLEVTFSRFRTIISNFAFSQGDLRVTSSKLDAINRDLSLAKTIQNYFI